MILHNHTIARNWFRIGLLWHKLWSCTFKSNPYLVTSDYWKQTHPILNNVTEHALCSNLLNRLQNNNIMLHTASCEVNCKKLKTMSTFPAFCRSFSFWDRLWRGGVTVQFHPQFVSQWGCIASCRKNCLTSVTVPFN